MAFVVHASAHFRQYMHSECVNFSQGNSSIGTFMGQAATQSLHPAFVHLTGSLVKPKKLKRFRKAKIAPWGQKYLQIVVITVFYALDALTIFSA